MTTLHYSIAMKHRPFKRDCQNSRGLFVEVMHSVIKPQLSYCTFLPFLTSIIGNSDKSRSFPVACEPLFFFIIFTVKRHSPFLAAYVTERKDLGVPGGKSLTRRYDNAQNAVHMFKRKADGLRPNDRAAPLAATRNVHLFSSFPRGKLGTRARTRACTIVGARRNHATRFCTCRHAVCMKFANGWLASHSRLNFSSFRAPYSTRAPIIFLLSRIASNIHAIFIATVSSPK